MDSKTEHGYRSIAALANGVSKAGIEGLTDQSEKEKTLRSIQIATLHFSRSLPPSDHNRQSINEMEDALVEAGVDKDWINPLPGNPARTYLDMFCNTLVASIRITSLTGNDPGNPVHDEISKIRNDYSVKSRLSLMSALMLVEFDSPPNTIQNEQIPYHYNKSAIERFNTEINKINRSFYKEMLHYGVDWKMSV